MKKTLELRWDWDDFNDNRLKIIRLQHLLHNKGWCVSSFNGESTYIHKGYKWQLLDQPNCSQWGEGKKGNWTYVHITKAGV